MKLLVSNPELKPKSFWFRLKPEQINWVLVTTSENLVTSSGPSKEDLETIFEHLRTSLKTILGPLVDHLGTLRTASGPPLDHFSKV